MGEPGYTACTHSHTAADTRECPRSCPGRLGDRDAPWENEVCTRSSYFHTAPDALESLQSCLGRLGHRDAPWENEVCTGCSHSHTAADTSESLRSCFGRLGDTDAPWENEDTQGPATPTRRRIHPSPSGPARADLGRNEKWPTCGQAGYLTPAASGIPTASERGAESKVAHLWARWLRNPCRPGGPLRFRAGGRLRSAPLVGKVAT